MTSRSGSLEEDSLWDATLAAEPLGARPLEPEALDAALRAAGEFADLESPWTVAHSSGVADLAAAAAEGCGLPDDDRTQLSRAGWVHDLGRVGVTSLVWEKPAPLSHGEREQVRMHPYPAERMLARPSWLAELGRLAATHHERLDGSGYHRGVPAAILTPPARILPAADAYHAMTEPRPHPQPVHDRARTRGSPSLPGSSPATSRSAGSRCWTSCSPATPLSRGSS